MRAVIEALKTTVALVPSPSLGQHQQLEGHKLFGLQIVNRLSLNRGVDSPCLGLGNAKLRQLLIDLLDPVGELGVRPPVSLANPNARNIG